MTKKTVRQDIKFIDSKITLKGLKSLIEYYEKDLHSTPLDQVIVKLQSNGLHFSASREMTEDEEIVYQELQRENIITEIKSKESELTRIIESKKESIKKSKNDHAEYKRNYPLLVKDHDDKLQSIQVKINRLSEYNEMLETLRLDIKTLDTKEFEDLKLILDFYRNFLNRR